MTKKKTDHLSLISNMPLFHKLNPNALEMLDGMLVMRDFARGENIFSEGSESIGFFIMINGRVNGNVYSSVHIELAKKAMVSGDVNYTMMEMVMGAQVNGNLIHKGAEKPRKGRKSNDPVLSEVGVAQETKVD